MQRGNAVEAFEWPDGGAAIKKTIDYHLTNIEEICLKIKLPSVEVRGILEITNTESNGVEIIKKILIDEMNKSKNKIDITYLGAPKYRLCITASDFKSAEKSLKPILESTEESVKKHKGTFRFTREESKKTRG